MISESNFDWDILYFTDFREFLHEILNKCWLFIPNLEADGHMTVLTEAKLTSLVNIWVDCPFFCQWLLHQNLIYYLLINMSEALVNKHTILCA